MKNQKNQENSGKNTAVFNSFRLLRHALLLLLFCWGQMASGLLYAQQHSVTGKVVDESGASLIGVSVVVKGTITGTQTDVDGNYTLNNINSNDTLVFSFVGMRSQTVPVQGRQRIDIVLQTETIGLDEIVVVAYGEQTKRTLTGAVSSVTTEDIVRTPSTASSEALVGKIQGVTARRGDARPGNATNLEIRNLGDPLYVVDGIPYGGPTWQNAFGFTEGSGKDIFNELSIEDIESITILKDASASIYGLRAANGVVLITTKSGKYNEKTRINVNGYYGWQNYTRFPHPANAAQFVEGKMQAAVVRGQDPSLLYTPEEFEKWKAGTERGYKSYDYFDLTMRPNVPQSYINVNATGGSQRTSYYFSLTDMHQDAIIKDYSYDRTNVQLNLESGLTKGLTVGGKMTAGLTKIRNVGVPGLDDYWNPFYSVLNNWPTEPPYANDNPNYVHQSHNVNVNPATYTRDITGWVDNDFHTMNINVFAEYDFDFGLTARVAGAYNFRNEDFDGFEYTYDAYRYDEATDTYYTQPGWGNQNPWREYHKRNVVQRFAQAQLNYVKTFGDHNIAATVAYERSDYDNHYLAIHTVPSTNYVERMDFSEQDYLGDSWRTEARAGYIGRVNYNFRQKYMLELLGRYDGSYLYPPDTRWGFFPGISAGWLISEEDFFRNALGNVFSSMKIRASYGETGSETRVSAFDYMAGYNFFRGDALLDGDLVIGLQPKGLPITNLSWTHNKTINLGLDFAMFENKLSGTVDVFERRRTGLPAARYDVLLPSEVGYSLPDENLNADAHRGVEGILTWRDRKGDFSYSFSAHATLSRRRILYTYKPRFGNSWDEYRNSVEDRWASVNWGYHVIGRFQSEEEIENYEINNDGRGNSTMLPGDFKYQDTNEDGVINYMDEVPIGYAQGANPYLATGINGYITWKNFSLAFDFAGGHLQSYRREWEIMVPFQSNGNAPHYMLDDYWRKADVYDPESEWIPGEWPAVRTDRGHSNFWKNDWWVTNVNYLRLKNLELGYNIPESVLNKIGISRLRVYVNGTNLFSFDNLKQFEIDPEVTSSSGLVYPQQRLVNVGFNLTF